MSMELDFDFEDIDEQKLESSANKTRGAHIYHRLQSERQLEELLPWEFSEGDCWHFLSGGDIDSLSFLQWILRQQKVKDALCSTWCMALTDVDEFRRLLDLGRIQKMDFYVGEIFQNSYSREYEAIKQLVLDKGGRVCVFKNHSKVFAGRGEKYDFVIESSANINTNPRTENTVITIDRGLCDAYFDFFDGIITFDAQERRRQKEREMKHGSTSVKTRRTGNAGQ